MGDIERLFSGHRIASEYVNYQGETVQVPFQNRKALLHAMGVNVENEGVIDQYLSGVDRQQWYRHLPALCLSNYGDDGFFDLSVKCCEVSETCTWSVSQEGVIISQQTFIPEHLEEVDSIVFAGDSFTRRRVKLPLLDIGYYDLIFSDGENSCESRLAIIPSTAYCPPWHVRGERLWGVIIQLYTLRSDRDWGIGDFADLRDLVQRLAAEGVDVVGLNPLHALLPKLDTSCSPYSPSDRRYVNPLYLSLDEIAEYRLLSRDAHSLARELVESVRKKDEVDYSAIKNIKYRFLEQMFLLFQEKHLGSDSDRGIAFSKFIDEQGLSLKLFALYELANNRWEGMSLSCSVNLTEAQLSDAKFDDYKLTELLQQYRAGILFHCYLQWLAHGQLQLCQREAKKQGMKIGLLRDLAVGADGSGAEVSLNSDLYCREAAIGAPPDPMAEKGQNWGLPPLKSTSLQDTGFRHFIELLRANMADCGALRIDHAMSLMRLWWCPPGKSADFGSYVYYPFKTLLGLLTLESQLNKCVIVGEDLGVVPEDFRRSISDAKIFTNKVFYFEREYDGRFRPPLYYAPHALAMVNNHDVPTLRSWWNKTDLELRHKLSMLKEGANLGDLFHHRDNEKHHLIDLLKAEGLCPEAWLNKDPCEQADEDIIFAILRLVARSSSQIYVVQLEDIMFMDTPVNVPGTSYQYPNWQRKLSDSIADVLDRPRIKKLLADINFERKPAS